PQWQIRRQPKRPRKFHRECGSAAGCRRCRPAARRPEESSLGAWPIRRKRSLARLEAPREHSAQGRRARWRLLPAAGGGRESKTKFSSVFAGSVFEKGAERCHVGLMSGEAERVDGFGIQGALELLRPVLCDLREAPAD